MGAGELGTHQGYRVPRCQPGGRARIPLQVSASFHSDDEVEIKVRCIERSSSASAAMARKRNVTRGAKINRENTLELFAPHCCRVHVWGVIYSSHSVPDNTNINRDTFHISHWETRIVC